MKKSRRLSEKLRDYSLLTGSMLAATAAHGQVIYTDLKPDIQLGGVPPTSFPDTLKASIDLDNNGVADFKISLTIYGVDTMKPGYNFLENVNGLKLGNDIGAHTYGTYHPFAYNFKAGDTIQLTANNEWSFANFFYQSGKVIPTHGWKNITDGYIGLSFQDANDSIHYGWIRLDLNTNDSVPNIVIKDYAYQATPNKNIAAGEGMVNGIDIVSNENNFSVFPNPSLGNCFIKTEKPLAGTVQLLIKDEAGREVYTSNVELKNGQALPLDFSEFPAGIYYITLKSTTVSLSKKWVKN